MLLLNVAVLYSAREISIFFVWRLAKLEARIYGTRVFCVGRRGVVAKGESRDGFLSAHARQHPKKKGSVSFVAKKQC